MTVQYGELQYWFGIVNYVNYVTYRGLCIDCLVLFYYAGFGFHFLLFFFLTNFLMAVVVFLLEMSFYRSMFYCFPFAVRYIFTFAFVDLWTEQRPVFVCLFSSSTVDGRRVCFSTIDCLHVSHFLFWLLL